VIILTNGSLCQSIVDVKATLSVRGHTFVIRVNDIPRQSRIPSNNCLKEVRVSQLAKKIDNKVCVKQ
jgi:hypothetical protein